MKHYKAILYDIDGTLINTLDMNMYPLMRIIEEELGEKWTFQQVLRFSSQPGLQTMDDLGIRDKEKTYARWVRYVNEYDPGAIPYEGIHSILHAFQEAGIRQAAVTSKMRNQFDIDVARNGLADFLETTVLADDTLRHKPHPDPIWECLKRMGLSAEDVLFIGDAITDLQSAQNAGVDFGFAAWGAVSAEGMDAAAYRFSQPQDLLQLLSL